MVLVMTKRPARAREKGHYSSARYSGADYPRSEAAKALTSSQEVIEVARNAISSDICRSIIDVDRYLHLAEAGYDVWYRAEMFVAQIGTNMPGTAAQRDTGPCDRARSADT